MNLKLMLCSLILLSFGCNRTSQTETNVKEDIQHNDVRCDNMFADYVKTTKWHDSLESISRAENQSLEIEIDDVDSDVVTYRFFFINEEHHPVVLSWVKFDLLKIQVLDITYDEEDPRELPLNRTELQKIAECWIESESVRADD